MLNALRLKNVAVVEEVEIEVGPGLTVMTGETGAGKSIVIDALALLAGGRAEADLVRGGAEEAVIEGVFDRTDELAGRLSEAGLPDEGPELCIRRTVSRQGKGRVHVNGALTTVGVLQRLMRGHVDIAGQHEHMALLDSGQHLPLLDRFGAADSEALERARASFELAWQQVRAVDAELTALGADDHQLASRTDFVAFQLEELERLAPKPGEDAALELERRRLASSDKLRRSVDEAEHLISSHGRSHPDGRMHAGALEQVSKALHVLHEAEKLDAQLGPSRQALERASAELDEAARLLSRYAGARDADPRRLAEVDDRLDALKRLVRKHAAPLDAIIAKRASLAAELERLRHHGELREQLEKTRAERLADAGAAARALTECRKEAGSALQAAVCSGLARLAMGHARFEVEVVASVLGPSGADEVRFLFCANPGEPLRPLSKVASGGEASRVMLAMKAALAGSDHAVCSIFDEADAGIGGAVADVVGRLIKDIAGHRQVICITHLPQVAAHADTHLRITKSQLRGKTRSQVERLPTGEGRAEELARMLSGVEVTAEALSAAQALLRSAVRHVQAPRQRKKAARGRERRVA